MELRWFKHERSLSYVLQVRYREGPMGEEWWGVWRSIPRIREGHEEEDMQEYEKLWT